MARRNRTTPTPKEDSQPTQEGDAVLEEVGIVLPESPRVYCVEIPRCLMGEKFVLANSEAEALACYRGLCGITRHREPAKVRVTDLDPENLPEGVELIGETQ